MPLVAELKLGDADAVFAGVGHTWSLSQPRLVADVLQLDQALVNSYSKHLLEGKSLPVYCSGMYSLKMAVSNTSVFSIPIVRGFTRLTRVLVSFWDGAADTAGNKWCNMLNHPNQGNPFDSDNDTFAYNMMIGPQRFPDFDCMSTQESFYRLQLSKLMYDGSSEVSLSGDKYTRDEFIIGQSFEKAGGASAHTGVNTRGGSQLTLNFKNLGGAVMAHVILNYEQVVNISSAGVEILD